ncbi:MAG: type II secretion system F family protein [Candidatus Solibacter usitatus]|nr:type II secretion system F family protein [Candidatus Solibacter usitatus]
MTTFFFKAMAADGRVRTGSLSGDTEKSVARELRKQGLTPVYVGVSRKKSFSLELPEFGKGRSREVLFFTQEMSTLLNAGVPLDRALSIVSELTERAGFRAIVLDVLRILKGGKPLADSLAAYPRHFSDLYVNMVRAGEASGALGIVFERLADFERSRDELRGFIVSSMMYPALLATVGTGSIFVLLNFVVPRFASVFEESRMKMPLPVQIMLEASRLVQAYWWIGAVALAAGVFAARAYIRTPAGRLWWDATRLRIPLLGDALRKRRRPGSPAPWPRWWPIACPWCSPSASPARS